MTVVKELFVVLGLDANSKEFKDAEQKVEDLGDAAKGLVTVFAGVVAGFAAATTGAVLLAQKAAESGDRFAKLGQVIGVSTDFLQEMGYIAERTGTSLDQIRPALVKLAPKAFEATKGNKVLADTFRRLGVDVKDASGAIKPTEQLFGEVANGLGRLTDDAERTRLVMQLFEEDSGPPLLVMFRQGADAIEEMRQEFRALGVSIAEETTQQAEKFQDTMLNVRVVVEGLTLSLGSKLMPVVQRLMDGFLRWYKINKDRLNGTLEAIATTLSDVLDGVMDFASFIDRRFIRHILDATNGSTGFVKILKALGAILVVVGVVQLGAFIAKLVAAASAIRMAIIAAGGLRLAFKGLILGAGGIGLAIFGLIVALDELVVTVQGGDSYLNDFIDKFMDLPAGATAWEQWLSGIALFLNGLVESLRYLFGLDPGPWFSKTVRWFEDLAIVLDRITQQFGALGPAFRVFGGALTGSVGAKLGDFASTFTTEESESREVLRNRANFNRAQREMVGRNQAAAFGAGAVALEPMARIPSIQPPLLPGRGGVSVQNTVSVNVTAQGAAADRPQVLADEVGRKVAAELDRRMRQSMTGVE